VDRKNQSSYPLPLPGVHASRLCLVASGLYPQNNKAPPFLAHLELSLYGIYL